MSQEIVIKLIKNYFGYNIKERIKDFETFKEEELFFLTQDPEDKDGLVKYLKDLLESEQDEEKETALKVKLSLLNDFEKLLHELIIERAGVDRYEV
jgi:hypothetical protein